jgi:hypothetical protein
MSHNEIIKMFNDIEECVDEAILICQHVDHFLIDYPDFICVEKLGKIHVFHRNMKILHRQIQIINHHLYNEEEGNIEHKINTTVTSYGKLTEKFHDIHNIVLKFLDKIHIARG